ncbi:DUF3164 family protein [Psychrobacter sp. HD31]|uniref:DUF3164 family protein n=1 Tax=Psychrobacter sp. HD31 TaxID=3112003 RepID=UPI003DA543DC
MNNQEHQTTPNGYMKNSKGHLVPLGKVKEIDKLRDEQVRKIAQSALLLNDQMATTKAKMFADFNDFVALSASEFDTKLGGEKGNVTMFSYDGSIKIQMAVSENIVFDERLQVAKTLIDECLHEWTEDSNDNIKAIINQAFQVDKQGKISTYRVMSLRSLNITDAKWLKAMQAIQDAVQVTSTKEYMRVYKRDKHGAYQLIALDFSNV